MNFHGSDISLQATIAAQSNVSEVPPQPHHPITCPAPASLYLFEDGRFACDHTEVPADDIRLKYALDHSIAILLIELAHDRFCS